MSNDFLTDFFRKIFAVSCVECKGLKDVMLCILNFGCLPVNNVEEVERSRWQV